jgi:hypothetical protein
MAKRTYDHVGLEDFEIKAQELISLTFDLCEQELRELRQHQGQAANSKRKALQFSVLSVLNSIKAFQAMALLTP